MIRSSEHCSAMDRPGSVDMRGRWRNERGSILHIQDIDHGGRITGSYRTMVGSPDAEEEFEVTGFAAEELLSLTANFGHYGSLTSWVGQYAGTESGEIIRTMWLLTKSTRDPDEPENADRFWEAVLTGASNFTRVSE